MRRQSARNTSPSAVSSTRRAPQQSDPEGPLQCFDLLADRLLGDVQVVGRPGEAASLRHRGKGAQLAEFEIPARRYTPRLYPVPAWRRQAALVTRQQAALVHLGVPGIAFKP